MREKLVKLLDYSIMGALLVTLGSAGYIAFNLDNSDVKAQYAFFGSAGAAIAMGVCLDSLRDRYKIKNSA